MVLAGYMQLLSYDFVAQFRNRVVNVHPALLPCFPGLDAVGQALEHGVKITGVTVHFVDEGATEHALYPEAIRLIAEGRVRIDPSNPRLVSIL